MNSSGSKWIQGCCIVFWTMPLRLKKQQKFCPTKNFLSNCILIYSFLYFNFFKHFQSETMWGGGHSPGTTIQVFYIILRTALRNKIQTKTDELTTLTKIQYQQTISGIWALRPLWPRFTHLRKRRLLLDTLPCEFRVICRLV